MLLTKKGPARPGLLLLVAALVPGCQAVSDEARNAAPESLVPDVASPVPAPEFARPGYAAYDLEQRIWIFEAGSTQQAEFLELGEPTQQVVRVGAGPGGRTLKATSDDVFLGYSAAREGFTTYVEDGRIWVFGPGDEDALAEFEATGEVAHQVIRPGLGPGGVTLKAVQASTLEAYRYTRPGFTVVPVDGRLWVFEHGSSALAELRDRGEPAEHVTRPGAGPDGRTLKAVDSRTIQAYLAAREGFVTEVVDDEVWVFLPGSEALAEYRASGRLADPVTVEGAGPLGLTVHAASADVLDAYRQRLDS